MGTIARDTAAAIDIAIPKSRHSSQFRKRNSSVTFTTLRSSLFTSCTNNDNISLASGSFENMSHGYETERLPDLHVLRRPNNGTPTAPTMFSVVSHSDRSSTRPLFRRETASSCQASRGCSLLRFFSARRGRQLSEAQLRKKVRKHCDRGDWPRVRKLISNHDFAEVPEVVAETNSIIAKSSSSEGKRSSTNELIQNPTSRRPSYGSRNGERLSFAGKESAAAAAVIKAAAAAAMLEEGSKSEDCSDNSDIRSGENILHDVCRHNPPLDVIELLLTTLRHRRGITCSRDDDGRTPLHVAVAYGASPGVIGALARADPVPATMGDDDNRSPLHLAVKFLAYQERNMQQSQSSPRRRSSSSSRVSNIAVMRKGKRQKRDSNANTPVLLKEKKRDEARQTLMILKHAMITYPGQIDFKDEDIKGFAPLDYAIDGSITDQAILNLLIRRNESRDLCLQTTPKAVPSNISRKMRNCFIATFVKQASLSSALSNEQLLRRQRGSTRSRSSVSSRNSSKSQDSTVLKQLEEEEISARRHRINRINRRDKKMRAQEGLFDVFGIDESITLERLAVQLDDQSHPKQHSRESLSQMSFEEQKESTESFQPDDKPLNQCSMSCREVGKNSIHSGLDNSMTTQGHFATAEQSAGNFYHELESIAVMRRMADEEMYNLHLQAYLDDTIGEFMGDLKYCDDLDFLYDDPDEIDIYEYPDGKYVTHQKDNYIQDHRIPIFEICVTNHIINEKSLQFDEFSEITCR
jgi:hypothetical protein